MDFRNNNLGAYGIGQRRVGGNGDGGGGSLNSAFYNNSLGNYNNGGANNSNLSGYRERMVMSNTNSNFNTHSNFDENRNRDFLMDRSRSPPIFNNRNTNNNTQYNNNSNINYGNRNPEGFMSRNRSPSPNPYNPTGMMSNNNRHLDREIGFSNYNRNTGNFDQQQARGERFMQQENFSRTNNMNVNQNLGERRPLMNDDDIFAAKRRYLENNMDLGHSSNNWNNGGKGSDNGRNFNDNGGNYGNHPRQSSPSQLVYGNRIYSDNPNPNYNLQNLEGNFQGRGGRNVNSRQEEMIFNQSGGPGNMMRNSDNDGYHGNTMYRENDGNFGRKNGNVEPTIALRDRKPSGVWQQFSAGNSNVQKSNQNAGYQSSSSDSWRASQRDFNLNRNLGSKADLNQNANRPVYNNLPTSSNNRNTQLAPNPKSTTGVGGARNSGSNQINNRQQKPQVAPMGNRNAEVKTQNIPQSSKPVQGNKTSVPERTRPPARPDVTRPAAAAARPNVAHPAAAAARPNVAHPAAAARPNVAHPTAATRPNVAHPAAAARPGVARPAAARPGVARPAVRPNVSRPAARPVIGRPSARTGVIRGSVVRGRVARPPTNRATKVQKQAVKAASVNVQKTGKPANSNTVTTPATKAEKRQRKMARKRGFLIGGIKLAYINNKREKLPQPEVESYALAFFEEKPIYTINVKSEEDEDAADIILDDVFQSEQIDDKVGNSEKPSRMMGKRARKQLRVEWSTLHDSKDYKNWMNWWTDYKRYGTEIHQELVKLGCLNLEHCFLPYLPNSMNLSTEQVVHGVIKSAQFALGDMPGMPYDAMKSIVTLMNLTFLENLKSEADLEILQDTIRSVPNELWLFKMRSMVHLWVKYKNIVTALNAKGAKIVTKTNDKEAAAVKPAIDKTANIVTKTNDKDAAAAKPTNDKAANIVTKTNDKEAAAVKPANDKEEATPKPTNSKEAAAAAAKPTNDKEANVVEKSNDQEAAAAKSTNNGESDAVKKTADKDATTTINDEGNVSFQWMAKQAFKNPCFHWLAMLAFNELETISEFAWPDHEKVFPTI